MRRRTLPLLLLVASLAPLRADILLSSGPTDNRAAFITGFVLTAGEEGFKPTFDGADEAVPPTHAALVSVKLTARDSASSVGMDDKPLYLKVYDSQARTRLLGCSANALRWDPPAGVEPGTPQTYRFENTVIPTDAPVWFAFEAETAPAAPLGRAGLGLTSNSVPPGYALLARDFQKFAGGPPTIELRLQSPDAESAGPLIFVAASGTLLALGAGGFLLARRRRTPALPPPPGHDL